MFICRHCGGGDLRLGCRPCRTTCAKHPRGVPTADLSKKARRTASPPQKCDGSRSLAKPRWLSTLLNASHRQSEKGFQARSATRPRTKGFGRQCRPRTDFSGRSASGKWDTARELADFFDLCRSTPNLSTIDFALAPFIGLGLRGRRRSARRCGWADPWPRSTRQPRCAPLPRGEQPPRREACCRSCAHRRSGEPERP